MATGWPMKTTYANGDVYSASDVNDTNGTINLLGQSVAVAAGKNKIINGAMQVWQRGTTITTTGAYTADRWAEVSGTSITYTRSTDIPTSLGFQYSMSRAGVGSNMVQRIEAANAAQLAGQTVTLSFYYKSTAGADSLNTTFYYCNSFESFASMTQIGSTQTIATPSTSWNRFSYTFTNISANAINGLAFYTYRGSGATSTTLMTGFQLEVGSTATAFQTATGTIQGELAACQRYYALIASGNELCVSMGANYTSTQADGFLPFPVTMRTTPTLVATSGTGYYAFIRNGGSDAFNSLTLYAASLNGTQIYNSTEISGTAGHAGTFRTQNASASIAVSAEL